MNDLSLSIARFMQTVLVLCTLCLLPHMPTAAAHAADAPPTVKTALSDAEQQAIDQLLDAADSSTEPDMATLDVLLRFAASGAPTPTAQLLPDRKQGSGIFYRTAVPFSFRDLLAYTMNPLLPGEAIYPNSVRRNFWYAESPIRSQWQQFVAPLPPTAPRFVRGLEYEQTTPDETSGCYYAYKLKRMFALVPYQASTALVMVSVQDGPSGPGLKGAMLGPDKDWNYVYSGAVGSTLPVVGWAETVLYDSATINIWTQSDTGQLTLSVCKWLKAGWSGMNVVKPEHISAGVRRYLDGFTQVMSAPGRPSPEAISARYAALHSMDDATLIAELGPFAKRLEALALEHKLDGKDFTNVLRNGRYAETLSKDDRIAELLKLFIRQHIGLTPAGSDKHP